MRSTGSSFSSSTRPLVVVAVAVALAMVTAVTFLAFGPPFDAGGSSATKAATGPSIARDAPADGTDMTSESDSVAIPTDFNITIPPRDGVARSVGAPSTPATSATAATGGGGSPAADEPLVDSTVPPSGGPPSTEPTGPPPTDPPTRTPHTSLTVRAQGTTGTELFEVWVGGQLVGRHTAASQADTHTVRTDAEGDVEVRFVNDGPTLLGNRDLTVDYLTVDDRRFESEAAGTYAENYWNNEAQTCDDTAGNPQVDTLHCNGRFRYARIVNGDPVPLGGTAPPSPSPSAPPPAADAPIPADARYVATSGSDSNPGTAARPWRTIQHAANVAQPGDVVVVRAGTYNESVHVSRSGAPGAWIEFRNHPGERPVVRATDNPGFQVEPIVPGGFSSLSGAQKLAVVPVSHIVIRGFDLAGENNTSAAGWASGLSIGYADQVRVLNNTIHGFPGGGVSTTQSGNVLVQGNQIRDVASTGLMQFSGLSAYQSVDRGGADIEPGYSIVFRDNDVRGVRARLTTTGKEFNADYVNVANPSDRADDAGSDGHYPDANCIIIDDGRHTQFGSPFPVFRGRTLVEGNTCRENMGRGVHVYLSDHVLARNNVLRNNMGANRWYPTPAPFGYDPWADHRWTAELNASSSSDVRFENNLVDAASGSFDRNSWDSSGIVFSRNRYVGQGIATSRTEGATFVGERTE